MTIENKKGYILKICVLGENTEHNRRFSRLTATDTFETDYMLEFGVDIPTKKITIEKRAVKLILATIMGDEWDIESPRAAYYQEASGCLILYETKNPTSLKRAEDYYRDFTMHSKGPPIPIALVGIRTSEKQNELNAGKQLADQLGVGYYETTLSDKQQVEFILTDMAEKVIA